MARIMTSIRMNGLDLHWRIRRESETLEDLEVGCILRATGDPGADFFERNRSELF